MKVLSRPACLTFTSPSWAFLSSPRAVGKGVVSPFQRSRFFSRGLSSDRSLFPGFVSVICGHYINSHGWPEEWERGGRDTHPELVLGVSAARRRRPVPFSPPPLVGGLKNPTGVTSLEGICPLNSSVCVSSSDGLIILIHFQAPHYL